MSEHQTPAGHVDLHVVQSFKDPKLGTLWKGYTYPVPPSVYDTATAYGWGRDPVGSELPGHDPAAPFVQIQVDEPVALAPDDVIITNKG